MEPRILDQRLLEDRSFWQGKDVQLPQYDRRGLPVKSVCFSAGRMAYGHTGDIMQDLLNRDPSVGLMVGVETFAPKYVAEMAVSDYLLAQLIFANEKDKVLAKIQGAIPSILLIDGNRGSLSWARLMELARDPGLQFATINAPEGAYGVAYGGGEFAEPISGALKKDLAEGTVDSDPGKWTAFARERFKAGLQFSLVSCTNFSGNGHYTAATLKTVARAWEERGHAPAGFLAYLSDPDRFAFPNTMIDRIAVAPDAGTQRVLDALGIRANVVVTEQVRYWAVEDLFPAGRPRFEEAEGVFIEESYEAVKKYEDMKLRILNMSHSVLAGLGVLLGYRGMYGIYRGMQDPDLPRLIGLIVELAIETVERSKQMDPRDFARDALTRLRNPNIPDDPMRIAFNGSLKMLPRFLDTYYAGLDKGLPAAELNVALLPVAGFLRYTMGIDDRGERYALEDDPRKELLAACGSKAKLGEPDSTTAFRELIAHREIMGRDLYTVGDAGTVMEGMARGMLAGPGAVRETIRKWLR